jgi:hypothetical protein
VRPDRAHINGGARNWLVGIPTGQFFFSKHTKTGANARLCSSLEAGNDTSSLSRVSVVPWAWAVGPNKKNWAKMYWYAWAYRGIPLAPPMAHMDTRIRQRASCQKKIKPRSSLHRMNADNNTFAVHRKIRIHHKCMSKKQVI